MERVLLLAPSGGLGGGIERYVATVEAAFARHGVDHHRIDALRRGDTPGIRAKLRFVWSVRRTLSAAGPARLVLAHPNLAPVLRVVRGMPNFRGATVIFHGCEIWAGRRPARRPILRGPGVRVVAASNFSAGALVHTCPAGVLPPGIPESWYDTLVEAAARPRPVTGRLTLVTAFRLVDWRDKGLPTLLEAVRLLGDDRVDVVVCGSGPVPEELARTVRAHPWCRLRPDLPDRALADELAAADLFVLATRTRTGERPYGEGFGLVLLEAQLAGTPVVAPAYGGGGDAFQPSVTGVSPVDESAAALARELAGLLDDEPRRQEMARAAADWSRRRFHPDAHSHQVLRALLDRRAPEPAPPPLRTSEPHPMGMS